MKLTPYCEALKMGKEKLKSALVPVRVKRAKKRAELEMCELEEQIATKQAAIAELCSAEDLNFKAIIKTQDELALLERRQEQYQKILEQMFPESGE